MKNAMEIKDKILYFIKIRGPSLPVHVAKAIELNTLLASAFLSELISEKRLKISFMKVGNSPIYFIPGQEFQLERFSEHLKSKEKEAFLLLKQNKFLKDSVQEPSIRVALRNIRDFAMPFKNNEEIIWKYFTIDENEFINENKKTTEEIIKTENEPRQKIENSDILNKKTEKKLKIKKVKRNSIIKSSQKSLQKENKFFDKIKEFLNANSWELKDILNFSKNEVMLLIAENNKDKILMAYNKQKINEKDISKASKKANEFKLPYILLSKEGTLKKIENLIRDIKNLDSIQNL